jgi:hypothetical protein
MMLHARQPLPGELTTIKDGKAPIIDAIDFGDVVAVRTRTPC